MAKVKIELFCKECGKEFTHSHVCASRGDADSYEEWALKNIKVCPDCRKKEQQEERLKQIEKNTKEFGLVDLKGSERQVKWALEIRHKFFEVMINITKGSNIDKIVTIINNFEDSVFWIENRHDLEVVPVKVYQKMKED